MVEANTCVTCDSDEAVLGPEELQAVAPGSFHGKKCALIALVMFSQAPVARKERSEVIPVTSAVVGLYTRMNAAPDQDSRDEQPDFSEC